jgi:tetratricopeptide (TPR) repeat protein
MAGPSTKVAARELHRKGLEAIEARNFEAAVGHFTAAVQDEPRNPDLLFNLGLARHRSGSPGLAIGLWRRALWIDPDHWQSKRAIEWARGLLKRPDIPRRVEYAEMIRGLILDRTTLGRLLFLTAILLLSGGWLILGWLGARRRASQNESALPAPPLIGIGLSLAFVLSLLLTAAKWADLQTRRATVIADKVEARSDGDPKATPLFELFVGLEVIVRREAGEWTQVTYPGGPSGWVPTDALFETQSRAAVN